jgi:uncharacterized protein
MNHLFQQDSFMRLPWDLWLVGNFWVAGRVQLRAMKGIRRASLNVLRLLLALALAFSGATATLAERLQDLPKPTDYVSDYAHVLSPEAIARIDQICSQLDHSQANAQIAVVTIHNLDGDDSADYATRLFSQMKIGAKGTDRGILLLFAVDDHKRSIKVGYGLEGILPDGKTGDIGRSMVPDLRANNFDGAVTLGVDEVAQVIAADAKVTLDEQRGMAERPMPQQRHASIGNIILIIILLIFFGGFFVLRLLASFGMLFGGWGRGPWIGGGGFGGGGGGFGGGGFGGGGDSGGGGGGFGGFGGGDTGGGGSDGSW